MSRPAELARRTAVSTLAQVVQAARGLFPFLVARLLGEAALGMLAVGWSWADLLSKLGIWGLDQATTIHTARWLGAGRRRRARRSLARSLAVAGLRSLLIAATVAVALGWLPPTQDPRVAGAVGILVWSLPLVAGFRIGNAASWGAGRIEHGILSKGIVEAGVSTLAFLGLWAAGVGVTAPLYAVVLGYGAGAATAGWLGFRALREPADRPVSRAAPSGASFARTARWIGLSDLLYLANMRADVLMLGAFASAAGAGVDIVVLGAYGLAVEIGFSLKRVKNVFEPVFVPVLAREHASNRVQALRSWFLAFQLALLGLLLLAAPVILEFFGRGFQVALPWTLLLLLANTANNLLLGEAALLVLDPRANVRITALGVAANVTLNLALIPRLGPTGAALATALTYGGQSAARLWLLGARGLGMPAGTLGTVGKAGVCVVACLGVRALAGGSTMAVTGLTAVLYCVMYGAWMLAGRRREIRQVLGEVRDRHGDDEVDRNADPRLGAGTAAYRGPEPPGADPA